MKIVDLSYEITDMAPGLEILRRIERAARTCYKSEAKTTEDSCIAMVKMLIQRGHTAMLEFGGAITVKFICDRGVTHEMVRHRLCSFAQESTRYCNYSADKYGNEIAVAPMLTGLTADQIRRREDLYRHSEQVYLAEIAEGVKAQQARDNLPTCAKTEINWMANPTEWRHIFSKRADKNAHPQMQALMVPLLKEFQSRVPVLFDNIALSKD